MDLPMFNIVINANEDWMPLFDSHFELMYIDKLTNISRFEYDQLKKTIKNWIEVCVYNTKTFEIARDIHDTYDQYEIKLKFPKYTMSTCLAVFRLI